MAHKIQKAKYPIVHHIFGVFHYKGHQIYSATLKQMYNVVLGGKTIKTNDCFYIQGPTVNVAPQTHCKFKTYREAFEYIDQQLNK